MTDQATQYSIQARARDEGDVGMAFLSYLTRAGELIPPWWSKSRDLELSRFWKQSDHLSGAIYSLQARMSAIPFRVEPRDPSIRAHMRQADEFTGVLLEGSEFGDGWVTLFSKWLEDRWTQDNGAFLEVIGRGRPDGPIQGPAVGLAHLDSARCTRTGNLEFPATYLDTDGKYYKIHRTRVIMSAEMPSARAEMRGVGFSAVSRVINTAQALVDDLTYKGEKMGSRPLRAIMLGKKLPPGTIAQALKIASSAMDARGQKRYASIPTIENVPADGDLTLVDLASLPDGFDYETDVTLTMFAIALAFGVPPRWLWPATTTGATKADAMYQHIAGLSQGPAQTLAAIQYALGGSPETARSLAARFLPAHLKMVFDYQDDEADRAQAEISKTRSDYRTSELNNGTLNVRAARQLALESQEMSDSMFEDLELASGRMPDGSPLLALFYNPEYSTYLDLGVEDPLDTQANDEAAMQAAIEVARRECLTVLGTETRPPERQKAQWSLYALDALGKEYKSPAPAAPTPPAQPAQPGAPVQAEAGKGDESGSPFPVGDLKTKTEAYYSRVLSKAVRDLYNGAIDEGEFIDIQIRLTEEQLARAWRGGARDVGIEPEDMSEEDIAELQGIIDREQEYILNFAADILDARQEKKSIDALLFRASLWAERFTDVYNQAKIYFGGKIRLVWNLGYGVENHCPICPRLNGIVAFAEEWEEADIHPQFHHGCECTVDPTEERRTPNALDKIRAIVATI